jgi:hypothetical protein
MRGSHEVTTTPSLRATPPEEGNLPAPCGPAPSLRATPSEEGNLPAPCGPAPALRATPPQEGNLPEPDDPAPSLRATHPQEGSRSMRGNSPPPEGWQAKPDGVVAALRMHQNDLEATP